ncbi:MAG TPA: alpha-glucan family phosphorylase [Thermoanaerobaculia bacterium]|jgi:starch phosphorylase
MNVPGRDPVCGMAIDPGKSLAAEHEGQTYYFCSEFCRASFLVNPARVLAEPPPPDPETDPDSRRIAYFSMEVGVDSRMPTYSGGLGVLAGDTLKSLADLRIQAVGVTLLYRKGYFHQRLDAAGSQSELPVSWNPADFGRPLPARVEVAIEGRTVAVRAWRYEIVGASGHVVPLFLLDSNLEQNADPDRWLTGFLYGGDDRYRLSQEIVLGIGGVRMLRALGYAGIEKFHMNEGHASLLALELLRAEPDPNAIALDINEVKKRCIFTTHTPVPAGHDKFGYKLVKEVLGEPLPLEEVRMLGGRDELDMTLLALNLSGYVNGVAKRHSEVSQKMFPGYPIDTITNGVHSFTWTADSFRALYDRHVPGWQRDPFSLRYAIQIPAEEVWGAHADAKTKLLEAVAERTSRRLPPDTLTIGFGRRATTYKRPDLVLSDPARLVEIARTAGRLQLLFAGKAHPKDEPGKELIRRLFQATEELHDQVAIVYLEDYDMDLARLLTSGVDLWLNTPLRPLEASGTSGMKAAHNGVPSLSILDGWWIEGHIEGFTGWAIGTQTAEEGAETPAIDARDASDLYGKLSDVILPLYYGNRPGWIAVMRRTIAFNASFFNTHRMVQQYAANAYV